MKKQWHIIMGSLTVLLFAVVTENVQAQTFFYERSYVNTTRPTGGTVVKNDVLEMRATIVVFSGTALSRCIFRDTVPNNTVYIPNTLRIKTNEGVTYASYTDAVAGDQAFINGRYVQFNIGAGATDLVGGTITGGTTLPRFANATIIMATYQVRDTAGDFNDIPIRGRFTYRFNSVNFSVNFTPINLYTYPNIASCSNYTGGNIVQEFGGTFGNGTTQNRASSAFVPGYTFVPISANQPNDGLYSIVNNTSPTGSVIPNPPKSHPSRVFTVFDIFGDHTGAASPVYGNPPVAPGANGGYMLLVNASYQTNAVISQTVTNVCPGTYYDFSAWFRNICPLCGADANGTGTNTPGVKPNLSFEIDGKAVYSTGEITYDSTWKQKGFIYLTGPSQTSLTFTIRNNAPGGGGNDWVMDDVSFAICAPNVGTVVSQTPVCDSNQLSFTATVTTFFNNYIYWKWQKSTNNGVTWNNIPGATGTGTPVAVPGGYQYTAAYDFLARLTDSGHLYRLIVATTPANLNDINCSYTDPGGVVGATVIFCFPALTVDLVSFNGRDANGYAALSWVTANEKGDTRFEIERSSNGVDFQTIGRQVNTNINGNGYANYVFNDPDPIRGVYFYRLKMVGADGKSRYSNVVILSSKQSYFSINSVLNPFGNQVQIELVLPEDGLVTATLIDLNGKKVADAKKTGRAGLNKLNIDGLLYLPKGIYTLQIAYGGQLVTKKLIKNQ
jgi:hypothetical protein